MAVAAICRYRQLIALSGLVWNNEKANSEMSA
jgi:hypothetical protein